MVEEASLDSRLKKPDEIRNDLLDEIKHNDVMSEKYKKTCKYLSYVGKFLILSSIAAGWVSVSVFASLVFVSAGITSSEVAINICAITSVI